MENNLSLSLKNPRNPTEFSEDKTMGTAPNPIGVLLLRPLSPYLQQELSERYALFKFWESPPHLRRDFLGEHSSSIRAVVCNGVQGADAEIIDALPLLEIVASHSSGLDKIDLDRCRKRGIRVTYTPDALTDEVADMAILLILATARRICAADRFVRRGEWKKSDFQLTAKVNFVSIFLNYFLQFLLREILGIFCSICFQLGLNFTGYFEFNFV